MEENKEKTQSDTLGKLFEALSKAQGKIESALKDKKNPFFKSNYADLASVWEACRAPLSENGLCVVQTTCGNKTDAYLITHLGHSSGEWIKSYLPLMMVKSDPQGMGSALTYARRYALSAIVGICQEDDDGNRAVKSIEKEASKEKVKDWQSTLPKVDTNLRQEKVDIILQQVTEGMEKELMDILLQDVEYKTKVDEFLGSKNFTSFTQLAYADFEKIMKRAKERLNDPAKSKV